MAAKKKLDNTCSCIPSHKWELVTTVMYIMYGAAMIIPAFLIEIWITTVIGASQLIAVVLVAPLLQETLKALPILGDFAEEFKDRLKLVLIVGFMFGSAEWMVHFFTQARILTFGFILHILFMTPLLVGYNKENRVQNYVALTICFGLHAAWNISVLGGLIG